MTYFLTLLLFLLFIFPFPVFATHSLKFTPDKYSIFGDEEIKISASMSGFTGGGIIRIKGAFYKATTSNYFGNTRISGSWIKNSADNINQPAVIIGNWDNILYVKNDPTDSGFIGTGEYLLKIGYYLTQSDGDLSSVNWSDNIEKVQIIAPTPTPTPMPTMAPTNTQAPAIQPSSTPNSTSVPTSTLVRTVSKTPTPTKHASSPSTPVPTTSSQGNILGSAINSSPSADPAQTDSNSSTKPLIVSLVLIGTGFAIIAGVLAWQKASALKFPT
jgi:hypothetical protein